MSGVAGARRVEGFCWPRRGLDVPLMIRIIDVAIEITAFIENLPYAQFLVSRTFGVSLSQRKTEPCVSQALRSRLLLDLGPGVFERKSPVEDQAAGRGFGRVWVQAEVADALELVVISEPCVRERWLKLCAGDDLEGVGIEIGEDVLAFCNVAGIGLGEEPVIETNFGGDGVGGRDPVHRRLDLAAVRRVAAAAQRI